MTAGSPTVGPAAELVAAFLRHRPAIERYLTRLVRSRDIAEDLTQTAFMRAYASASTIQSPEGLLFATARRLAIDHFRRVRVAATDAVPDVEHVANCGEALHPEAQLIAREQLRILCGALESLPLQQRRVFTLRKVYNLSHAEIASELNITVSTAQKHLTQAIKTISRIGLDE